MREIPFDDESFDCVYEHYAMCHLSKRETATAIGEMQRVAKRGGLCFLGVISMDSWPKSLYGVEREPGEYWAGDERHSMFTDKEADVLVSEWEVLSKEKRVIYQRAAAAEISEVAWLELYDGGCAEAMWRSQYEQRVNLVNYTHIYYILRKL
jgi:ubiquinone/menaquinone biosynthesis C-methylase UbiE